MKVYAHTLLLHSSIPTQPSVIPRATPLWITRAGTYTCLRYVTDIPEVSRTLWPCAGLAHLSVHLDAHNLLLTTSSLDNSEDLGGPSCHWMSLEFAGGLNIFRENTGCHWTLVASSVKKYMQQGTTSQKLLQNQLPLQSLHQGAPWTKKNRIPGINLHLVHGNPHPCKPFSLILPSYILATLDGAQNVLGCHCHKSKYVHRQTATMLCYAINIAAASEYRSVQSNTCAGMTSDASSVICKCDFGEKWVQGLSDHATKNIKTLIGTGSSKFHSVFLMDLDVSWIIWLRLFMFQENQVFWLSSPARRSTTTFLSWHWRFICHII